MSSSASRPGSLSLDSHRSPHRHRFAFVARPHRLSFPAKHQKFKLRRLGSIGARFSVHCSLRNHRSGVEHGDSFESARGRLRSVVSFLPGGGWWSLRGHREDAGPAGAKAVLVVTALRWIWSLIAKDRLVIFAAFGSLTVAAVRDSFSLEAALLGLMDTNSFERKNELIGRFWNR